MWLGAGRLKCDVSRAAGRSGGGELSHKSSPDSANAVSGFEDPRYLASPTNVPSNMCFLRRQPASGPAWPGRSGTKRVGRTSGISVRQVHSPAIRHRGRRSDEPPRQRHNTYTIAGQPNGTGRATIEIPAGAQFVQTTVGFGSMNHVGRKETIVLETLPKGCPKPDAR